MDEALVLAAKMPSALEATNDGKGVPVTFTFTSLNTIRENFQKELQMTSILSSISDDVISDCLKVSNTAFNKGWLSEF